MKYFHNIYIYHRYLDGIRRNGERSLPRTKISALLPGKALVTLISQPGSLPIGSSTGMTRGNLSDTIEKLVGL